MEWSFADCQDVAWRYAESVVARVVPLWEDELRAAEFAGEGRARVRARVRVDAAGELRELIIREADFPELEGFARLAFERAVPLPAPPRDGACDLTDMPLDLALDAQVLRY